MKDRQREEDVRVEWSEGLSRKPLARFRFARYWGGGLPVATVRVAGVWLSGR